MKTCKLKVCKTKSSTEILAKDILKILEKRWLKAATTCKGLVKTHVSLSLYSVFTDLFRIPGSIEEGSTWYNYVDIDEFKYAIRALIRKEIKCNEMKIKAKTGIIRTDISKNWLFISKK